MSALSIVAAQEQFTATLPAVEDVVRYAFGRRLRPQEYEEALAEARAAAWSAWAGLVKKGQDPVAVGVHGIAANAVRHVKNGRRLGNRSCGRGVRDVFHPKAQKTCEFKVISLDSGDEFYPDRSFGGEWREWLAGDNRVTPADEAAFRLDLQSWLAALPRRKGQVAELLAEGHPTGEVARLVGLSQGRISQLRLELEESWTSFQAGPAAGTASAATR